MRFSPVFYTEKIIGYSCELNNLIYFFGTENSSRENLELRFPNLVFSSIKQTHGDLLVRASATIQEADAHWTDILNQAPLIATADCAPILISGDQFVCAIHAGWRGVANEILLKTLKFLAPRFFNLKNLTLVVGPHIQRASFEVDSTLALKFQKQYRKHGGTDEVLFKHISDQNKSLVDLKKLLTQQAFFAGLSKSQVFEFSADTKTDRRFSSFRRQRDFSGRNLNFVSRLKK